MIEVIKRDGRREPLDLDKIHTVLNWAADDLKVSISAVELKANPHFFDGIKSSDIHETLIKSAADLITEWESDYATMAARLNVFHLRKKAFGRFTPTPFLSHITEMTKRGLYDSHILDDYSTRDIDLLGDYINHDRDLDFKYAAIKQLEGKYLVQNRVTGEIFESPQQLYMLVAMCLFASYPVDNRLDYVRKFYDAASMGKISLPTPIMAGVRTPTRQFSSCVLIESGDSLDEISAASAAIVKYVSQRAGIGINGGRIRALGSEIRNGEAYHTGVTPFYKHFQTAVKSCSQGGVRGGAATMFYPMWHLECESMLVLKNNRGVEENRVRHLDYGVQINGLMYKRLISGGNITLFSPHDVPGMYDAFFADQVEFERLYIAAESDPSVRKKTVKAVDLFGLLMSERASTGRIYIQNVDHCNTHSPFDESVAPVRQSNLCVAPETQILTDKGYFPIAELEGETVNVWNGEEWSETTVVKTGENKELIEVTTYNGKIQCTEYHKWYMNDGSEVRAKDLKQSDKLIGWTDPDGNYIQDYVMSVVYQDRIDDTYCFTEPKRHMGVFNGILTGQCLEVALPTKPLKDINDPEGEIALCTLSAFNLGAIELSELPELADLVVRALDSLLDYQNYPIKAAEIAAKARRTLGVGVTNLAYFLAKNGVKYSDGSANNLVHKWMESIQFNLLDASCRLAKEHGACEWFDQTKYSQGLMPVDHYKRTVDEFCATDLYQDWDRLRGDVLTHGLRNSTLTALMPCETSSQITNSTNGIEPPRGYMSVKQSKDGILRQVVPEFAGLFDKYELLWDIPNNEGYLQLVAIMQKFTDQAISANTNYDPRRFDGGKIPMRQMLKDLLTAYKYGVKTLYYQNTRDGQGDEEDEGCEGGACRL